METSESRYRAIVEEQTELICRFSPDDKLTFVNPNYCRYFGKPYEELIGVEFYHMIPEAERERVKNHLASLSWKNPVGIIEHYVITPDGNFRAQQWSDRAIFNEQGQLVEFQSVGRDITAQKQAEESLRQQSRTLERFSANLKHLHRINTINYQDFDTLFTDCLDMGCEIFGLSTGIISQIIDQEAEPTPNPSKEGNRRQNPPLTPPRRGTGGCPDEEISPPEDEGRLFPIPNSQFPIPNSQFPIPNSQF
ncbi:MAG: PAS domain S-box protein, partial [Symploca sp. SIO2E6]|nr:PAS domain S-box protein [Symploca sp. SIO2E6]